MKRTIKRAILAVAIVVGLGAIAVVFSVYHSTKDAPGSATQPTPVEKRGDSANSKANPRPAFDGNNIFDGQMFEGQEGAK